MPLSIFGFSFELEMWHIVTLYIIGFPVVTYLHLGLYYWVNGGSSGRHHFWFPYQNLWQDIEWNFLPGGEEKRVAWMKAFIDTGNGWFCGVDFEDIRTNDRYLEMSYKVTSPFHFIFLVLRVLIVGAVFAPFVIPFLVLQLVAAPVGIFTALFAYHWQRSFTYFPS